MTSPIDATSSTTPIAAPAPAATPPLDREAFLKLLVAQLSHQDPLQPMQGTEFVAQLSQFAMVEQSVAQSAKLDTLSTQMGGISNSESTSLVGKQVSIRGHGIAFDGVSATASNVTLPSAATVSVTIRDANGTAVRTLNLGPKPAGVVSVVWDGKNDVGQPVPKGAYSLDVKATGANGSPVSVSQDVGGIVTKVAFDKGYPELTLDSGAVAPVSDLVSVGVTPPTK